MSHLVGVTLITDFGVDGKFHGRIDKYDDEKGHHIVYEDGDDEWVVDIQVRNYFLSLTPHSNCFTVLTTTHTLVFFMQEDEDITFAKKPRRCAKVSNVKTERNKVPVPLMASKDRSITGQTGTHNRVRACVVSL